jgi:hypothetical protein
VDTRRGHAGADPAVDRHRGDRGPAVIGAAGHKPKKSRDLVAHHDRGCLGRALYLCDGIEPRLKQSNLRSVRIVDAAGILVGQDVRDVATWSRSSRATPRVPRVASRSGARSSERGPLYIGRLRSRPSSRRTLWAAGLACGGVLRPFFKTTDPAAPRLCSLAADTHRLSTGSPQQIGDEPRTRPAKARHMPQPESVPSPSQVATRWSISRPGQDQSWRQAVDLGLPPQPPALRLSTAMPGQ